MDPSMNVSTTSTESAFFVVDDGGGGGPPPPPVAGSTAHDVAGSSSTLSILEEDSNNNGQIQYTSTTTTTIGPSIFDILNDGISCADDELPFEDCIQDDDDEEEEVKVMVVVREETKAAAAAAAAEEEEEDDDDMCNPTTTSSGSSGGRKLGGESITTTPKTTTSFVAFFDSTAAVTDDNSNYVDVEVDVEHTTTTTPTTPIGLVTPVVSTSRNGSNSTSKKRVSIKIKDNNKNRTTSSRNHHKHHHHQQQQQPFEKSPESVEEELLATLAMIDGKNKAKMDSITRKQVHRTTRTTSKSSGSNSHNGNNNAKSSKGTKKKKIKKIRPLSSDRLERNDDDADDDDHDDNDVTMAPQHPKSETNGDGGGLVDVDVGVTTTSTQSQRSSNRRLSSDDDNTNIMLDQLFRPPFGNDDDDDKVMVVMTDDDIADTPKNDESTNLMMDQKKNITTKAMALSPPKATATTEQTPQRRAVSLQEYCGTNPMNGTVKSDTDDDDDVLREATGAVSSDSNLHNVVQRSPTQGQLLLKPPKRKRSIQKVECPIPSSSLEEEVKEYWTKELCNNNNNDNNRINSKTTTSRQSSVVMSTVSSPSKSSTTRSIQQRKTITTTTSRQEVDGVVSLLPPPASDVGYTTPVPADRPKKISSSGGGKSLQRSIQEIVDGGRWTRSERDSLSTSTRPSHRHNSRRMLPSTNNMSVVESIAQQLSTTLLLVDPNNNDNNDIQQTWNQQYTPTLATTMNQDVSSSSLSESYSDRVVHVANTSSTVKHNKQDSNNNNKNNGESNTAHVEESRPTSTKSMMTLLSPSFPSKNVRRLSRRPDINNNDESQNRPLLPPQRSTSGHYKLNVGGVIPRTLARLSQSLHKEWSTKDLAHDKNNNNNDDNDDDNEYDGIPEFAGDDDDDEHDVDDDGKHDHVTETTKPKMTTTSIRRFPRPSSTQSVDRVDDGTSGGDEADRSGNTSEKNHTFQLDTSTDGGGGTDVLSTMVDNPPQTPTSSTTRLRPKIQQQLRSIFTVSSPPKKSNLLDSTTTTTTTRSLQIPNQVEPNGTAGITTTTANGMDSDGPKPYKVIDSPKKRIDSYLDPSSLGDDVSPRRKRGNVLHGAKTRVTGVLRQLHHIIGDSKEGKQHQWEGISDDADSSSLVGEPETAPTLIEQETKVEMEPHSDVRPSSISEMGKKLEPETQSEQEPKSVVLPSTTKMVKRKERQPKEWAELDITNRNEVCVKMNRPVGTKSTVQKPTSTEYQSGAGKSSNETRLKGVPRKPRHRSSSPRKPSSKRGSSGKEVSLSRSRQPDIDTTKPASDKQLLRSREQSRTAPASPGISVRQKREALGAAAVLASHNPPGQEIESETAPRNDSKDNSNTRRPGSRSQHNKNHDRSPRKQSSNTPLSTSRHKDAIRPVSLRSMDGLTSIKRSSSHNHNQSCPGRSRGVQRKELPIRPHDDDAVMYANQSLQELLKRVKSKVKEKPHQPPPSTDGTSIQSDCHCGTVPVNDVLRSSMKF